MKYALVCALLITAGSSGVSAAQKREKFADMMVHPHEGSGPEFKFSAAYATSESPVVITVVGRKMKSSDRKFRTSLQKHWLSQNIPDTKTVMMREQALCNYGSREGRCDRYEFEPGGEEHSYYFYLDNWR
ncbi:hypothetical protein [Lysobacter gummosus]|jgi:hypothetical protein|uniref:Uncharacterized protein n=1 Tax=Lysobacter gummosus TaxID=262324 RepID=A0ABY3XDX9_9GAMM|nr:hypothetical protein [Lysobacter gummosus]UNP29090.1 hypothetical protein MOV92_21895 [Lysobacter gummosus]